MRVGGRFAGEVAGIELLEGGVDVVGVELETGHRPVVGVDLDDAERLGVEGPGFEERDAARARRSPRVAMTVDVMSVANSVGCMFAICTSRPRQTPAFTTRRRSSVQRSSANNSAKASQSRAAKYA